MADYAGAGPYQMVSDPAALNVIAGDPTDLLHQLVYPTLVKNIVVDVSDDQANKRSAVASGALSIPNPRTMQSVDLSSADIGVALDAFGDNSTQFFPREEVRFTTRKYEGFTNPTPEILRNGHGDRVAFERNAAMAAGVKMHYDTERKFARQLMTEDNWYHQSAVALSGGGGKIWTDPAADLIGDLVALYDALRDKCNEPATHIVIPEVVARAISRHPSTRGYFVLASGVGTAAAAGGAKHIGRKMLKEMIGAMLADNSSAAQNVEVVIPNFRPSVAHKRKSATAADRVWIWGENKVGIYHLDTGGPGYRTGGSFHLRKRSALAYTLYSPDVLKFRTTERGAVYAHAYRGFDLPVVDKAHGFVLTNVLS